MAETDPGKNLVLICGYKDSIPTLTCTFEIAELEMLSTLRLLRALRALAMTLLRPLWLRRAGKFFGTSTGGGIERGVAMKRATQCPIIDLRS